MEIMINAKNFKELKKQLRQIQGKSIFKLTRTESMNDGEFIRVLYKVNAHDIVFWDGKQSVYLDILNENDIEYFNNGFKIKNCTYELVQIMGENN